jgi:hypothetical protein
LDAALDGMRKGQISAAVLLSAKPVDSLARYAQFNAVRLLPIPYTPAMRREYQPSTLRHDDYPTLLGVDEIVDTIAVRSALFAYNWPSRNERYQLLEFFVQTFFSRFSEFLGDAHHPKWRELNLAEPLPGWKRFAPAELWLERQRPRAEFDRRFAGSRSVRGVPAPARTGPQAGEIANSGEPRCATGRPSQHCLPCSD